MWQMYRDLKEFNDLVKLTGELPEYEDLETPSFPTRQYIQRALVDLRILAKTTEKRKP